MNAWGRLSAKAKRKALTKQLEFLNQNKEKFSWDNEELDLSKIKVWPNLVTPHNDIPAEMPGVRLESDLVPETSAVEQPREPTMAQRAAHVLRVAGLAGTTGVRDPVPRQTTGVIDMSEDADDSDSDDEEPPRLPDGSDSDSDSDDRPQTARKRRSSWKMSMTTMTMTCLRIKQVISHDPQRF